MSTQLHHCLYVIPRRRELFVIDVEFRIVWYISNQTEGLAMLICLSSPVAQVTYQIRHYIDSPHRKKEEKCNLHSFYTIRFTQYS